MKPHSCKNEKIETLSDLETFCFMMLYHVVGGYRYKRAQSYILPLENDEVND